MAIGGLLSGCTAGFRSHSISNPRVAQPVQDLSHISIVYSGAESACLREYRLGLETTLRQRYHIFKIGPAAKEGSNGESFRIEMKCTREESPFIVISLFTFGLLPVLSEAQNNFNFNLVAPNGDSQPFKYGYTDRTFAWLPLIFFGSRYQASALSGDDDSSYQKERIRLFGELATNFIDAATPFLLAHSKP